MNQFVIPKKLKSNKHYKNELSSVLKAVDINRQSSSLIISEIKTLGRWWKPSEWEELILNLEFLIACTTLVVGKTDL